MGSWKGGKFLTDLCGGSGVSQDTSMLCAEGGEYKMHCTSDRMGMAPCMLKSIGSVPPHFQYFPHASIGSPASHLMDNCPYVERRPSLGCHTGASEFMPGSVCGVWPRCFDTTEGLELKDMDMNVDAICANVKCDHERKTYAVKVRGARGDRTCNRIAITFPVSAPRSIVGSSSVPHTMRSATLGMPRCRTAPTPLALPLSC